MIFGDCHDKIGAHSSKKGKQKRNITGQRVVVKLKVAQLERDCVNRSLSDARSTLLK